MSCTYCTINVWVYDNKCSGCRSRLIHKTAPSQVHASKMIDYLRHTTKMTRQQLIDEYVEWRNKECG